jgi:ADP-heptose:LPS heptosyltransferase
MRSRHRARAQVRRRKRLHLLLHLLRRRGPNRRDVKKLILKSGLATGDIVLLTAAVRDLHKCYPGEYLTDVRTPFPAIWEHNPYLTPLSPEDPGVEEIECSYPLINRCNHAPYHCLHGFIEFLNERLALKIKPTAFQGDIHLSAQENAWYSQVHELAREAIPFWIVAAGGKYDVTIKWWETARYQEVVNHFRGRIQFVQVGAVGDHHPKLEGVIDLRGRTDLRQLIRLVHHAQGVLCPVTALMHLAAAVETRPGEPRTRACVVVAGGREPAHWEAYPEHQFIHTNGALPCCTSGGCWKDRTEPLRDGDPRDRKENLCSDARDGLPHCMRLIEPDEVIRRISIYFDGGALKYLAPRQKAAAERGMRNNKDGGYDLQPLTLHSAGKACDQFIESIPEYIGSLEGRGIVTCGGGARYLTNAWVCINRLRDLGCQLPIQLWQLSSQEKDARMEALLAPLGVQCVNAEETRKHFPVRKLCGWALKPYAILRSPFHEVLLLDADNVPVRDPSFLFETTEYRRTGALFWPDYKNPDGRKAVPVWRSCGLRRPSEPEFESGQILVDKRRAWRALHLALWFNEHSDFYYRYVHGDKETFHLAFRKLGVPYTLIKTPIKQLPGIMCQHDLEGHRLFQHRNGDKWDLFLYNRRVADFWHEARCRHLVRRLRSQWDGGMGSFNNGADQPDHSNGHAPAICAVLVSSAGRDSIRRTTIANLARTDWQELPLIVECNFSSAVEQIDAQADCALRALKAGLSRACDYVLYLEDDLEFNRNLRHNLCRWKPLRNGSVTVAGLFNPGCVERACDLEGQARIVAPPAIFGSPALIISRPAAQYIVRNWRRMDGTHARRIGVLAGRFRTPIFFHAPSLAQRVQANGYGNGTAYRAVDFQRHWKA